MRKTILLISICLGILLLFTACLKEAPAPASAVVPETSESPIEATPQGTPAGQTFLTQTEVVYYGFTKAVAVSDSIYIGEYISRELTDWGDYHYAFKVKEVWRGEIPEETAHLVSYGGSVSVVDGSSYEVDDDPFQKGKEYLLITERQESLFDEYPQYTIIGNMFIPVEDFSKSTMYNEPLEKHTDEKFEDLAALREWIRTAEPPQPKEKNFTWATDFPTVVKEAELILEVTITGISVEGVIADANVYFCDVSNLIKGDSYVSFEGRNDIAVSLKGGLEIGGTYLVMCNRVDATSIIYIQSSPVSVIPLSDTKTIEEIYALVAGD